MHVAMLKNSEATTSDHDSPKTTDVDMGPSNCCSVFSSVDDMVCEFSARCECFAYGMVVVPTAYHTLH